jgi:hypothetical protein
VTHGLHVQVTSNYDRFEVFPCNRDVRKTKKLEASMRKHGFLSACAIHVVPNGSGKLRIKKGHRRFQVARSLGIPIKYLESDDKATLFELETTTEHWNLRDFLDGHVREGKPAYAAIREYHERTGIPLSLSIGLLGGHTSVSNFTSQFKEGTFKISGGSLAATVADIVVAAKQVAEVATHSLFVQALARCVLVPQFDPERLKKKLRTFGSLLVKAPTLDRYAAMIEAIYNCHAPRGKQLNVAFLADQAARDRKAAKKR